MPAEADLKVRVGDRVKGGVTVLGVVPPPKTAEQIEAERAAMEATRMELAAREAAAGTTADAEGSATSQA